MLILDQILSFSRQGILHPQSFRLDLKNRSLLESGKRRYLHFRDDKVHACLLSRCVPVRPRGTLGSGFAIGTSYFHALDE